MTTIHVKTVCALLRRDQIFVIRCIDPADGSIFYKPPGGTVEFGESARSGVIREVREELGATLDDVRRLGVVEQFGTWNGQPFHAIVFIFIARFVDSSFYDQDSFEGLDHDAITGELAPFTAGWMPLESFSTGAETLCPRDLLPMLGRQ